MNCERYVCYFIKLCYCSPLVYDVSNQESFQALEVWLNELDTYSTKKDLVKMLVGNKIDKQVCRDRLNVMYNNIKSMCHVMGMC